MAEQNATLWGREPALIIGMVQAGLALAIGFGLALTSVQMGLILAFTASVLAFVTRSQVTPAEGSGNQAGL